MFSVRGKAEVTTESGPNFGFYLPVREKFDFES